MANRTVIAAAALAALGGVWMARRSMQPTTSTGEAEAEQETPPEAPIYQAEQALQEVTGAAAIVDQDQAEANAAAFLAMIRKAEGTAGPNGYRTIFGGRLFTSYADHPRQAVQFKDGAGRTLWTSAAGAYQFLAISPIPGGYTRMDTWDRLQRKLGLVDFSPASQDAAALELIREAGALADVRAGRFDQAVTKVRTIWASMPGAGYAQPERRLEDLRAAYITAGGFLA